MFFIKFIFVEKKFAMHFLDHSSAYTVNTSNPLDEEKKMNAFILPERKLLGTKC